MARCSNKNDEDVGRMRADWKSQGPPGHREMIGRSRVAVLAGCAIFLCLTAKLQNYLLHDLKNPTVLYTIDSYFVSPDDPRNGQFKVPNDLVPEERKWAQLLSHSERELNGSPYDWGSSWPSDPLESISGSQPKRSRKNSMWANPAYKLQLDSEVDKSLKKTMSEVDDELRTNN